MKRKVSDLSPEEFQKTFPIVLKEHNPQYPAWYQAAKEEILGAVSREDVGRISHIGSSAVPGLLAKPIVDILLEIDGRCNVTKLQDDLKRIGFGEELATRSEDPFRLLLAKGMSCGGFAEKVFLLHVRYLGDWNELYFRDYLLAHPEAAEEYGRLKQGILRDIESGKIERMPGGKPNGYSQAKLEFVERMTAAAKKELAGKYRVGVHLSP